MIKDDDPAVPSAGSNTPVASLAVPITWGKDHNRALVTNTLIAKANGIFQEDSLVSKHSIDSIDRKTLRVSRYSFSLIVESLRAASPFAVDDILKKAARKSDTSMRNGDAKTIHGGRGGGGGGGG